jgi:WXXGXW repeat (2 copies)
MDIADFPTFQTMRSIMKLRLLLAQAALVAAGAITVATASAQVVVVAPNAPPAMRYEPVPPARAGYVWDRGHWRWDHGQYVWNPGHWQAERIGYHWIPGHWIARGGAWRWAPGHWA